MDKYRKILQDCLGDDGCERLEKAIFRRGTNNVADPLELYLPLMVVPRTILSWLVQNIGPMKVGENRDLKFPGRADIGIHIIKDNTDVYRGEFIQGGKIIHEFEKQTLPSMGGHLMTVGEQYDHLASPNAGIEKPEGSVPAPSHDDLVNQEIKADPSLDMPKKIIELAVPQQHDGEKHSEEEQKWMWSHANVRELTGVIGKLVDALVHKKVESDSVGKAIDEIGKEEMQVKIASKVKESTTPEELEADTTRRLNNDPKVIKEGINGQKMAEIQAIPADDQPKPKPKNVPQGKDARSATVESEKPMRKDAMDPSGGGKRSANSYLRSRNQTFRQGRADASRWLHEAKHGKPDHKAAMDRAVAAIEGAAKKPQQGTDPKVTGSVPIAATKKDEMLSKPYVSDAQRRWAHTSTGTKALGGKAAVHHWDESTKGKKLPEKVTKDALFHAELDKAAMGTMKPAGAGMPKAPTLPQAPKPPVAASKNPAGAAAKQAQSSGKGGMSGAPKMPTAPKMPGAPKMPSMKSEPMDKAKILAGPGHESKPGTMLADLPTQTTPRRAVAADPKRHASLTGEIHPNSVRNEAQARGAPKGIGSYLRSKIFKNERVYQVPGEEIYSPCEHCGKPEFTKTEDGPKYAPCHCFRITLKNDDGKPTSFVKLSKTQNGYNLTFDPDADPDSVRAFLLTMKATLLTQKKLGV